MLSLPAACNPSSSCAIRGYTLSRKCFPVDVKLPCGLLRCIMDHSGGRVRREGVRAWWGCAFSCCVCADAPVETRFGIFPSDQHMKRLTPQLLCHLLTFLSWNIVVLTVANLCAAEQQYFFFFFSFFVKLKVPENCFSCSEFPPSNLPPSWKSRDVDLCRPNKIRCNQRNTSSMAQWFEGSGDFCWRSRIEVFCERALGGNVFLRSGRKRWRNTKY